MAVPVPVPKDSLFKLAVDLTKASVKQAKGVYVEGGTLTSDQAMVMAKAIKTGLEKAKPKSILDLPPEPKPAPVGVPGVPLVKAKAKPVPPVGVPAEVVTVAIPYELAQSIANKPATGGGWQAIMGDLQAVLKPIDESDTSEASHVLHLKPYLLAKLVDKATAHGVTGGYQGILKTIICLAVKQHPGQILGGGQ